MDGPPPQEEDFTSLSIANRLSHKNWKARVSAYEALIKLFQNTASDTDPAFKPYVSNNELLKKIVTDANVVAQEKGVECVVALVKYAGEAAAKTREAVIPALVDKCFGSSRAATKSQAIELALQYAEVENNAAGVVNDLLPGLGAKQPKTVAGCITALKEIVRIFGVQVAPPQPVLKSLPKVFSHSDKTVRSEGTALTHALYQYIGQSIEPWLAELKPVQVKELKEAFEAMEKDGKGKGSIKPERVTRAHAREMEASAENDTTDALSGEEQGVEAALDPRAFAEPVDIASKLSPSLQTDLKSSKWKERKEALDDLSTLLSSTPRIKDSPELADLTKSLATRIASDANINCVMVAAKCIEDLSKAMMNSFAKYREAVVPPMLERLKERKANVTDSIGTSLDAVFSTSSLTDIIPDLESAMKNKNPQIKEGTLKFLARCLSSATSPIQTAQIKPLAEVLATLLEDGFEGARNEAAICLGTFMKMVGERPLNATLEGLADVRRTKVKEAFEKATVKCKIGSSAPSRPPARPSAAPTKKSSASKSAQPAPTEESQVTRPTAETDGPESKVSSKKPSGKPPARSVSKKPAAPVPAKAPPVATGAKSAKSNVPATAGSLDTFKYKHTPEEAEAIAAEAIPANLLTDLGDANWKTRLAALDELTAWIEGEVQTVDAEVIIRSLAKKGWAEKNFQVSSKIYGILSLLADKCPSFGRSCPALCVAHLTEKLGDAKLKKPAGETLTLFAEKTSLQFVLNQAYEPLLKQKAPKVLADAVTWINVAVTEFGIAGLSLRSLIDFLKVALQNSNAAVRGSATKALVAVKLYAGPSIKDLIQDLNPQLLNTILAEFDKVENNPAPEPIRTSIDAANVATNSSSSGKGVTADPLDDLFPRVEIDILLKGTSILSDAKSDAWKTKKEALEGLQAILDHGSNKRLKPTMGEIGQVLKARVSDSNKAVQALALDVVSRIATGMGKAFEKHVRLFMLPVSNVLADQKAPIRAAALQTLTVIATACEGLESMVAGISSALESTNPVQKGTLLHWLTEWFREHDPPANLDISSWAPFIVSSLDDRNTDVRKGAQAFLPSLVTCAGFEYVMQQTNSLKPASRSTVIPLIQAARPAIPANQSLPQGAKPTKSIVSTSDSPPNSPPVSVAKQTANKVSGVRRKLPPGTSRVDRPENRSETPSDTATSKVTVKSIGGPKRPAARHSAVQSPPILSVPFHGTSQEVKRTRLGKDVQKWVNESGPMRKDLAELLQSQMEPFSSKELVASLFSHDHNAINDHITGLTTICDFYNNATNDDPEQEAVGLAVLDLPLKYVSIKAHEPQSNLTSKCLDTVEAILSFVRLVSYQLTDAEALCFVPTMIFKLGDAREQIRSRISQMIQTLPMVYAYSRVFQLLLDYGLKSKVAKTRQGALDELAGILKRSGMGACDPAKAFPLIATMIADKDSQVRRSALSALSEGYILVGEKIWSIVGSLPAKEKTQLEERLRRIPSPATRDVKSESSTSVSGATRLAMNSGRPNSPAVNSRIGAIPRPASPSVAALSRSMQPSSPTRALRSTSPITSAEPRPGSPAQSVRTSSSQPTIPSSPKGLARPKTMLPSRLARPRPIPTPSVPDNSISEEGPAQASLPSEHYESRPVVKVADDLIDDDGRRSETSAGITIAISSILSSDPARSVDALKKIQKVLMIGPETGPSSLQYRELAEHTEGLIETITLQMAHVFERLEDLVPDDTFRLAKHLIQTLNNFCDHAMLAESLTVDNLTSLLEELTLRLLETDDSSVKKIKDLSRFINMIILRLFATGRRMSIFRALFTLLLRIVKPFPSNGTLPDSKESKVAELVLKCVWKLARNIPQDLNDRHLDPVELFPAIEQFLQSVPPNEWRARATNKVPCGDMPLRTIKVIIQHVVAHYGDDVYDLLSESFDDPSATIVYPYVYRILNSGARAGANSSGPRNRSPAEQGPRAPSPSSSRPLSPQEIASTPTSVSQRHSPSHRTSPSSSSTNGHILFPTPVEEPDPDAQLLTIIGHISSETTGALHKEGITELHHFLKAYPHKRPRVEKMLESTGAAFRKYINRALASRAAEDQERDVAVAHTLSKLESNKETPPAAVPEDSKAHLKHRNAEILGEEKMLRLHDIYQHRPSNGSPRAE
ncbi:hypothetical protein AX17_003341 [Amanita inopinata Kibby_2008]|nr:hypothetical protein AX17_003341 [Amanita inopinata Kibby_2008]